MNASNFTSLPAREKKKIVKSAIQGANRDQRALMERFEKTVGSKVFKKNSK